MSIPLWNTYQTAIDVDQNGDVYFGLNYSNSRLYRLFADGNTVQTLSTNIEPWDLEVVDDRIVMSARHQHAVGSMNKGGTDLQLIAGIPDRPGFTGDGQADQNMLDNPRGIFVDSDGSIFIADSGNGLIRKVDTDGVMTTVAENIIAADLVIDSSRNIVATDYSNCSVKKILGPF